MQFSSSILKIKFDRRISSHFRISSDELHWQLSCASLNRCEEENFHKTRWKIFPQCLALFCVIDFSSLSIPSRKKKFLRPHERKNKNNSRRFFFFLLRCDVGEVKIDHQQKTNTDMKKKIFSLSNLFYAVTVIYLD